MADDIEKLIEQEEKRRERFSKGAAKSGLAPEPAPVPKPVPKPKPEPVKKTKKGWW